MQKCISPDRGLSPFNFCRFFKIGGGGDFYSYYMSQHKQSTFCLKDAALALDIMAGEKQKQRQEKRAAALRENLKKRKAKEAEDKPPAKRKDK